MADIQWLACCEGIYFAMQHKFVLKELCVQCIQTKQFYTFHVLPGVADSLDVDLDDKLNQATIACQVEKHNLTWHAGTMDLIDVRRAVERLIPKTSDVFTVDYNVITLI